MSDCVTKNELANGAYNEMEKKHIDDAQPTSIDEHFESLLKDQEIIDYSGKLITADDLPKWLDKALIKQAQAYYLRNVGSMAIATMTGVILVLAVPNILKILIFSEHSNTQCLAYKRYYRTIFYINDLYLCDPMDSDSNFYMMLNTIRRKHLHISKRAEQSGIKGIYGKDMALTQYGFIGSPLLKPKEIGLHTTAEDEEAFNHFWRVIGHMLGIPDRLNICRKNVAETRILCEKIQTQYRMWLNQPPSGFEHMTKVLVDGLWYGNILLNYDAVLVFTYNLVNSEYQKPLSIGTWLNVKYNQMLIYLYNLPLFGTIVRHYNNTLAWTSYRIVQQCSLLAWSTFGRNDSQVILYHKKRPVQAPS